MPSAVTLSKQEANGAFGTERGVVSSVALLATDEWGQGIKQGDQFQATQ